MNNVVNYVHGRSNANTVFINGWNPDHILGIVNDPSYPNTIYNPNLIESTLTSSDYYLLESCPISHNAYTWTAYEEAKAERCVELRTSYGISLITVSTIDNAHPWGSALYNLHKSVADYYDFDGEGTSDLWYGAGSSQVKMWS